MSENHERLLRDLRKKLIAEERGEPLAETPPAAATPAERDEWHNGRMKSAAAAGNLQGAREHAVAMERSVSRSLRVLASERLRLLATRPAGLPPSGRNLDPGTVYVSGVAKVAVLGRYVAYGRRDGLTDAVLLLKKAPEELDVAAQGARPEIIDRLGGRLCALLYQIPWFAHVDFVVPTPPDPGRFAQRLYHPPSAVAQALARYSTVPTFNDVLIKTRSTQTLRELGPDERTREIQGSMAVADGRAYLAEGRCVLVLDDIVTWGTHFREATRALRAARVGELRFAAITSAHGYVTPI
jgi:hypothetical protein